MNSLLSRPLVILSALSLLSTLSACSSGSNTGSTDGTTGPVSGGCDKNVLTILFSPMYTAFDGTHRFQVPAVVNGLDPDSVTWHATDTSMVDLQPDNISGGVMITALKAGTVNIVANAGNLCGSSQLTITNAVSEDWMIGSARYNEGVVLRRGPGGLITGGGGPDAGAAAEARCTNCHGETANGPFKTVSHTPMQIGGFSDAELTMIFRNGMVPKGGYFDATIVSYEAWQGFHKWDMTEEQAKGIVVYLRALTPAPQTGSGNFGGRFDGGIPDGGRRPDGGPRERPMGGGNGNDGASADVPVD